MNAGHAPHGEVSTLGTKPAQGPRSSDVALSLHSSAVTEICVIVTPCRTSPTRANFGSLVPSTYVFELAGSAHVVVNVISLVSSAGSAS